MEGYPSNSTWPKTTHHVFLLPESQSILVLGLHSWSWNTGFTLHISFEFMQAISFPFLPGIIFWAHSCLHFLSNKQALTFHESYDTTTSFKPFLKSCHQPGRTISLLCPYIMQIKNHHFCSWITWLVYMFVSLYPSVNLCGDCYYLTCFLCSVYSTKPVTY